MTRRESTGRVKRACALLVVIGTLCTMYPVTGFAESKSTTASVDFTSEPTTRPVPPVDPDWPEREFPDRGGSVSPADVLQPGTGVISGAEHVPTGESAPVRQIPGATGAAGWLAINYVTPLHYDVQIAEGVFTVRQERPYLQTSDLRGTATGWKVTAIAGPFQDPEDARAVQALLRFCHGSPNCANASLHPPEIPIRIDLPANGSTQRLVEYAHENEGMGIWVTRWYPTHCTMPDFQLRLFAPVSHGRLGSVLWIMNDAP